MTIAIALKLLPAKARSLRARLKVAAARASHIARVRTNSSHPPACSLVRAAFKSDHLKAGWIKHGTWALNSWRPMHIRKILDSSFVVLTAALLCCAPRLATAQDVFPRASAVCPVTLYFGNGINTDEADAYVTAHFKLGPKVNQALLDAGRNPLPFFCVDYAYATKDYPGVIGGVVESIGQAGDDVYTSFWEMVGGLVPANSRVAGAIQQHVQEEVAEQYESSADLQSQVSRYRAQLTDGTKTVVVVAHSQGNFFANEAFRALTQGLDEGTPIEHSQFRIVSVATPAGFVATGDDNHTTLYGDIILAAFGRLPANTDIDDTPCEISVFGGQSPGPHGSAVACHLFDFSYLVGKESKRKILGYVLDNFPRIDVIAHDDVLNVVQGGQLSARPTNNDVFPVALDGTTGAGYVEWFVPTPIPGLRVYNDGTFTLDLAGQPDAVDPLLVQYKIHTPFGDSDLATVRITVSSGSHDPITATGDFYTVRQGEPLTIAAPGVLANDIIPAGSAASVEFLPPFPPVSLTNTGGGGFTLDFGPNPSFVGTTSFSYVVHTALGDGNVATVTVRVTAATSTTWTVDFGPNAHVSSLTTDSENRAIALSRECADSDCSSARLVLSSVSPTGNLNWQRTLRASGREWSGPGNLLIGPQDRIYVVVSTLSASMTDGEAILFVYEANGDPVLGWPVSIPTSGAPVYAGYGFANGHVLVDKSDGALFIRSAAPDQRAFVVARNSDGSLRWRRDFSTGSYGLDFDFGAGGRIYTDVGFPSFTALDRATGNSVCSGYLPGGGYSSFVGTPLGTFTAGSISGEYRLYLSGIDCGTVTTFVERGAFSSLYPLVFDQSVLVATEASSVQGSSDVLLGVRTSGAQADGQLLWRNTSLEALEPIAYRQGMLYVLGIDPTVNQNLKSLFLINMTSGQVVDSINTTAPSDCWGCIRVAVSEGGAVYTNMQSGSIERVR
jgi:hypothetical protein